MQVNSWWCWKWYKTSLWYTLHWPELVMWLLTAWEAGKCSLPVGPGRGNVQVTIQSLSATEGTMMLTLIGAVLCAKPMTPQWRLLIFTLPRGDSENPALWLQTLCSDIWIYSPWRKLKHYREDHKPFWPSCLLSQILPKSPPLLMWCVSFWMCSCVHLYACMSSRWLSVDSSCSLKMELYYIRTLYPQLTSNTHHTSL